MCYMDMGGSLVHTGPLKDFDFMSSFNQQSMNIICPGKYLHLGTAALLCSALTSKKL